MELHCWANFFRGEKEILACSSGETPRNPRIVCVLGRRIWALQAAGRLGREQKGVLRGYRWV